MGHGPRFGREQLIEGGLRRRINRDCQIDGASTDGCRIDRIRKDGDRSRTIVTDLQTPGVDGDHRIRFQPRRVGNLTSVDDQPEGSLERGPPEHRDVPRNATDLGLSLGASTDQRRAGQPQPFAVAMRVEREVALGLGRLAQLDSQRPQAIRRQFVARLKVVELTDCG